MFDYRASRLSLSLRSCDISVAGVEPIRAILLYSLDALSQKGEQLAAAVTNDSYTPCIFEF